MRRIWPTLNPWNMSIDSVEPMAKNTKVNEKTRHGWQDAEDNTLRVSMNWTFLKKLEWLEEAQKLAMLFKPIRKSSPFSHPKTGADGKS